MHIIVSIAIKNKKKQLEKTLKAHTTTIIFQLLSTGQF